MNTKQILQQDILHNLPPAIREMISKIPAGDLKYIEEIRLRAGKPLVLNGSRGVLAVLADGTVSKNLNAAYTVKNNDIAKTFELLSNSSIYAIQQELKNGFITISGGHRVGVAGRVVMNGDMISLIKDISSVNIRISKEILGAADSVIRHIAGRQIKNTLIVSPPQCGKTTMLRDITRQLSYGIKNMGMDGVKVGVVDERCEIGGCYKGVPQKDIGPQTDILDACPKAYGMMMMLRSMSPDVMVTDEIGRQDDVEALEQVLNSGIKIITSVHGYTLDDVFRRPVFRPIKELFECIIILGKSKGTGTVEKIINRTNSDTC